MVNIFLLNWNDRDLIKERLLEINSFDEKLRIVIINNDIDDITKSDFNGMCEQHELHVVNNRCNLGYAGGNNSGLSYLEKNELSGDIIIANPDITLSSTILHSLLSARQLDKFGAVMTAAHNEKGKVLYRYIKLKGFKQYWICESEDSEYCHTDYVAGSLFLISREAVNAVGLFDERFFLYWEEVDLSFRVKMAGFELYSLPSISIQRKSNSLSRIIKSQYYLTRNTFLIKNKFPCYFRLSEHIFFISSIFLSNLKLSIKCKSVEPLKNVLSGIVDGYMSRYY